MIHSKRGNGQRTESKIYRKAPCGVCILWVSNPCFSLRAEKNGPYNLYGLFCLNQRLWPSNLNILSFIHWYYEACHCKPTVSDSQVNWTFTWSNRKDLLIESVPPEKNYWQAHLPTFYNRQKHDLDML